MSKKSPDNFSKSCPFRVFKEEHPPVLRGNGSITTEEFYPCIGEDCMAYRAGICLRLTDSVKQSGEEVGKWIVFRDEVEAFFKCPICGFLYIEAYPLQACEYDYCPKCGARLDGGQVE